jgi:hypothetical protein
VAGSVGEAAGSSRNDLRGLGAFSLNHPFGPESMTVGPDFIPRRGWIEAPDPPTIKANRGTKYTRMEFYQSGG